MLRNATWPFGQGCSFAVLFMSNSSFCSDAKVDRCVLGKLQTENTWQTEALGLLSQRMADGTAQMALSFLQGPNKGRRGFRVGPTRERRHARGALGTPPFFLGLFGGAWVTIIYSTHFAYLDYSILDCSVSCVNMQLNIPSPYFPSYHPFSPSLLSFPLCFPCLYFLSLLGPFYFLHTTLSIFYLHLCFPSAYLPSPNLGLFCEGPTAWQRHPLLVQHHITAIGTLRPRREVKQQVESPNS